MQTQSMKTDVTCYAGTRYPERPRTFLYEGCQLEVARIDWQERTPHGLRFRVCAVDGRLFWLEYNEARDAWDVRLSRRSSEQEDPP